jgi:DNA polymerase-3 subunit alpha
MDDRDHMAIYIEEARRMKINILPPDINKSFTRFEIENGSIRFGLNAIKDVNGDSIVDERTCNGEFFDLVDFISRTQGRSTTIKTILSLGKAGALDKLGYSRKQIITMSDNWKHYKKAFCNINGSQFSLFSDDNQLSRPQIPPAIISNEDILEMEKEVLGTYLGEHPLSKYRDFIQENTCWSEDDYDLLSQGEFLRFAGIIKQVRTVVTRKGSEMAFVEIEGLNNKKTVTMFPLQYAKFKPIIKNGQAILIAGNINIFRDEKNITVVDAKRLDDIELSIIKEQ